jgi:hypothetical protein
MADGFCGNFGCFAIICFGFALNPLLSYLNLLLELSSFITDFFLFWFDNNPSLVDFTVSASRSFSPIYVILGGESSSLPGT